MLFWGNQKRLNRRRRCRDPAGTAQASRQPKTTQTTSIKEGEREGEADDDKASKTTEREREREREMKQTEDGIKLDPVLKIRFEEACLCILRHPGDTRMRK